MHLAGSELRIGQNSAEICESPRTYVGAIEVAGRFDVGRSVALTESQAFDTRLNAVLKIWSVVSNEWCLDIGHSPVIALVPGRLKMSEATTSCNMSRTRGSVVGVAIVT